MKTTQRVAAFVLVACVAGCSSGDNAEDRSSTQILRVERAAFEPPVGPHDPVPESRYVTLTPTDAYVIEVTGALVVVTSAQPSKTFRMVGVRQSWGEESVFELKPGQYAGGTLVMRPESAELRIFASNVPFVSSEIGSLHDHFTR